MHQILLIEIAVKGLAGALLVLAPVTLCRLFGLANVESGFWPRLAGALLIGLATGMSAGLANPALKGAPGAVTLIAINLCAAVTLLASLILGSAAPTRRGRFLVLVTTLSVLTLGFLEIAHI